MTIKVNVSSATFNEVVQAFTRATDRKYEGGVEFTIKKTDTLNQPINFVLAAKRLACLEQAVKVSPHVVANDVVKLADEMYQWVITGEITEYKPEGMEKDTQ